MEYPSVFDLISQEFEKAKIPYLLIGGFAVNFYKVSRATEDIDFLMALEYSSPALEVLKRAGYKEEEVNDIFAQFKSPKISLLNVDLMFVDKQTFSSMIREAKEIKFAGCKFVIPSLKHLIALKLHAIKSNPSREFKDMPDIIQLLRRNGWDILGPHFRDLCGKFGSSKIYDKIKLLTSSS